MTEVASMRIVAPLAYSIRYIPRKGSKEKNMSVVELMEWDIPEASMSDTTAGISARVPIRRIDRGLNWIIHTWRLFDGDLIREAGRRPGGFTAIEAQHLPRFVDGTVRSNFTFQFLSAMGLDNSTEHYNAAVDLMTGKTTVEQERRSISAPEKILGDDRDAAIEFTQRILSRFVLIDGRLWKRTPEPLLKLTIENLEMRSDIDYNERDECQFPDPRATPSWVLYLPFCDQSRIAEIEGSKQLPPCHHVAVDNISAEAPVTRDGNLWHASRAANYLIAQTAERLGNEDRQAVESWMALRELVNAKDATAGELLEAINVLRGSLSDSCSDADAGVAELLTFVEEYPVQQTAKVSQPRSFGV
jgi:hypothetical protein